MSLKTCEDQRDLGAYALTVISDSGLRFGPTISQRLAANLGWLNKGGWAQVKSEFLNLATIPRHAFASECITKERHAARFVMTMDGFGPKQSRNLWQCMGVSRYEIPLDSRLAKWVNALPATFGMDTKKLPNAQYYEQVESHVQAVCEAAGVFPCDFDAAVFVSADDGEWPENDQVR